MDERSSFSVRLLNPTGGLVYHLRARRYRDSLWTPFRRQIAQFLEGWHPPEKELLILGPSGGYTLPTDFLERFDRLWLFDPDPLAPLFFRKLHPALPITWSRQDLIFRKKKFVPELLSERLNGKNVAVLFSNLLGQLPLIAGPGELSNWWTGLQPELKNHSWLSYHDLFSFPQYAGLPARLPEGPIVPQLVEWALRNQKALELTDHGTNELFPNSSVSWTWHLSPHRTQIVGAVCNTRRSLATELIDR